jgi:hypothetical protein
MSASLCSVCCAYGPHTALPYGPLAHAHAPRPQFAVEFERRQAAKLAAASGVEGALSGAEEAGVIAGRLSGFARVCGGM